MLMARPGAAASNRSMRPPLGVVSALLVCSAVWHGALAQDNQSIAGLVARASQYVADYERDFSALVGELHETQRVISPSGAIRKQRAIVADILLVKNGDATHSFRDVLTVDGKAVRNREERLRRLFIDGQSRPLETQAHAVDAESSRYNIGIERGMDTLMLPLTILHPDQASGFRFARASNGLTFTEVRSPTLVRSRHGGDEKDLFLRGSFTLGPDGASVHAATLMAENDFFIVSVDVQYVEDAATRLLVPLASSEDYRVAGSGKADRTEVRSVFSNFRRFQVKVDEQIELPHQP
jgi:hypothetical protein